MIKNVILDTGVFILWIVGLIDEGYIKKFIKTKMFSIEDFEVLNSKISTFEKVFITPHILAEFSHQTLEQTSFRDDYKKMVRSFLLKFSKGDILEENQIDLVKIFSNDKIYYLGVADISIVESSNNNYAVITSDGRLADTLRETGKIVFKFIPTQGFVSY